MPYAIKECAGTPYVPSNGSEGQAFIARFCRHCIHDTEQDCGILFRALAGCEPPEWTHDADGRPQCTAFSALTFDEEQRLANAHGEK